MRRGDRSRRSRGRPCCAGGGGMVIGNTPRRAQVRDRVEALLGDAK